jgi:hypothetical protein
MGAMEKAGHFLDGRFLRISKDGAFNKEKSERIEIIKRM